MEVPQDIAFEIFSWLPAKSVCKLDSSCNSVSGFPKETVFKRKQSRNLLGRDDTCLFIQPERIIQKYEKQVELHPLPEDSQSSGVPKKVLRLLSNSTGILGSSNGLLLCKTINDHGPIEFFIFNPITKCRSFIPTPASLQRNHDFANINIMLDCSSDDYKVFLFENPMEWSSNCYTCSVYHEKEGVWKTMDNGFLAGGRNMNFDMYVFHNKAIHVISDCSHYFAKSSPFYKPYIMSYHLENGNSTMLRLPREAIRGCHTMCNMSIFNWGKVSSSKRSICLVKLLKKSIFTVWFLKDYKSSSWKKVLKVRVRGLGLQEKDPQVTGFTVMNGDLLVFATEEKVYSCGLNEERFMMVEEICEHNCRFNLRLISYSDTFRSCGTNVVPWN